MEEDAIKQVADATEAAKQAETAVQAEDEAAKQVRLNFNVDASKYDRLRLLADYTANEGLITGHPRGNITGFVNWCMEMGEKWLQQYAMKKRGF